MGKVLRYRPVDDSSPGLKTEDPSRVVLVIACHDEPEQPIVFGCPCGCGDWPKGKKALFAMGHDARLKGKLIRAHLHSVEILYYIQRASNGALLRAEAFAASQVAQRYGWMQYLLEAENRREDKNMEVFRRSQEAGDACLQVGRWEHTGGQVAAIYKTADPDRHRIEYVTRAGDIRAMRIDATTTPLATAEQEGAIR